MLFQGGPQDYPHMWQFTKTTHRTRHTLVFRLRFITAKGIRQDQQGKKTPAESEEIHAQASFIGSLLLCPRGDTLNVSFSPAEKIQPHLYYASTSGSPLETQHLRFLLGVGHIGSTGLVTTQIPNFQKEIRCLP